MIEVKGQQFGLGGSTFGFNTLFTASIEGGFGAVILTNSNNGPKLAHELMRMIAYEYNWPGVWRKKSVVALSEAQYQSVAGRYQTRNGIFEMKEADETLRFVTDDGRTIPRCGYRLEDFVDDDIGGEMETEDPNASRDGFCTTVVQSGFERAEVREPAAVYRLNRIASVTRCDAVWR